MTKVFCIGLHKTGTTTLAKCFEILGLRVCPEAEAYKLRAEVASRDYVDLLNLVGQYDAFEDSPWNYRDVYRVLDTAFPESRFILTVRDSERWVDSILRWAVYNYSYDDLSYYETFGCSVRAEFRSQMINGFESYCAAVKEYFSTRPGSLLVMDVSLNSWKALCEFLELPIPNVEFPHMLRFVPGLNMYTNLRSS